MLYPIEMHTVYIDLTNCIIDVYFRLRPMDVLPDCDAEDASLERAWHS